MDERSIAVVGATGFVGRQLLQTLRTESFRATAVVRGLPDLVAARDFHSVYNASTDEGVQRFDVVVNLAYPTSGPPYSYPKQNAAIFHSVERLVKDGGRLVHVSTQAVFGATLDLPVEVGPVSRRRDDPYVESKIDAEVHFTRLQARRGLALDVVRLGNVWGLGSGSWGVPLIQKLLTGRPVGIVGRGGFSNATDVANASSYLAFLTQERFEPGVRFHHLAEFSHVPWSEWVTATAEVMGVEPVYADPASLVPPRPVSGAVSIRGVYRNLAEGRVSGSWTRSGLRLLPDDLRAKLKGRGGSGFPVPELDHSERMYVQIMATAQEFKSSHAPGWSPPVSRKESLARFLDWLRGFDA